MSPCLFACLTRVDRYCGRIGLMFVNLLEFFYKYMRKLYERKRGRRSLQFGRIFAQTFFQRQPYVYMEMVYVKRYRLRAFTEFNQNPIHISMPEILDLMLYVAKLFTDDNRYVSMS